MAADVKSAEQILSEHRITYKPGRSTWVTTGPKCPASRKKKRDPCLSVKITNDAVLFNCHHCGEHGGEFFDAHTQRERGGSLRKAGHQRRDRREISNLYR